MLGIGRIQTAIRDVRLRKIHKAALAQRPELADRISGVIDKFRNEGGLKHGFQYYKLLSLYRILEELKPRQILELGSGTTTAVFADYVASESTATLTVIDESQQWLDNSRMLADIDISDDRYRLLQCGRVIQSNENKLEIKYDFQADRHFDFVMVDGPSMDVEGKKRKDAVNSNIIELVGTDPPETILVSVRKATAEAFARRYSDIYNITMSDLFSENFRRNYTYFSIFTRK